VGAANEGNALRRQLPWPHSAISRNLIVLAAGGALCVGLAAAGTPAAAPAPSSAPPAVTAGAFQVPPASHAAGTARAVTTAFVRRSDQASPARGAVIGAPRRALADAATVTLQRAAVLQRGTARQATARLAAIRRAAGRAAARQGALVRAAAVRDTARRALRAGLRRESRHPVVVVQSAAFAGTPREIAAQMLAADGWTGQFFCLDALWERESGWNVYAENPSSGAYGIPQALNGWEMASAGPDWWSDAATQIRWGLDYIQGRYGSPCGAWDHEMASGWY
jgi:hypothetical protein